MLKKKLMMATMLLATATVSSNVFAVNILSNSGFETGALAPWFQDRDFSGNENWNVTSALAHTGNYSATDDGNKEIRQNLKATSVSDITEVSFWLYSPDDLFSAYLFFYSDGTNEQRIVSGATDTWAFFDVTSELDAGKSLVAFSLFGNSVGRTYLDDVTINASVPEPATLTLMGLGMAGVGYQRRRRLTA